MYTKKSCSLPFIGENMATGRGQFLQERRLYCSIKCFFTFNKFYPFQFDKLILGSLDCKEKAFRDNILALFKRQKA